MSNVIQDTRVVTGLVRFSYLHIFEKSSFEGQEEKYSASFIIPKSDIATIEKIKKTIQRVLEQNKVKFGGKIPTSYKNPLRDGDIERPDDPAYRRCYFINASSKKKPSIVDKQINEIFDEEEVYSGCYGRAGLTLYAFNKNGNKGVACNLDNIQKLKEGEPLGGKKVAAESDFNEELDLEDIM